MNITNFKIDPDHNTVDISASGQGGPFVNISGLKLEGHEEKKWKEVKAHAREAARHALQKVVDQL